MLAHLLELDRAVFLALFGGTTPGWVLYVMLLLTIIGRGYILYVLVVLSVVPHSLLQRLPRWFPHHLFSRERQRLARELLVVLVGTALIVYAGKALIQRPRPYLALDLVPLGGAHTDFSCPSGHAAGAFSFAAFFVARLHPSVRSSALLLTVAAGIAVSRIYLGAHYPSDVLAGGLLGAACGGSAGRLFRKRAMARAEAGPQLANTGTHGA